MQIRSAQANSQVCYERVEWLIGFLFSHVEPCTFEDRVSLDYEMLIKFLFYFGVFLLVSLCESKTLDNIVCFIAHAVNHSVNLQDFVLLVEFGRYAISLEAPYPFWPFFGILEIEGSWYGAL